MATNFIDIFPISGILISRGVTRFNVKQFDHCGFSRDEMSTEIDTEYIVIKLSEVRNDKPIHSNLNKLSHQILPKHAYFPLSIGDAKEICYMRAGFLIATTISLIPLPLIDKYAKEAKWDFGAIMIIKEKSNERCRFQEHDLGRVDNFSILQVRKDLWKFPEEESTSSEITLLEPMTLSNQSIYLSKLSPEIKWKVMRVKSRTRIVKRYLTFADDLDRKPPIYALDWIKPVQVDFKKNYGIDLTKELSVVFLLEVKNISDTQIVDLLKYTNFVSPENLLKKKAVQLDFYFPQFLENGIIYLRPLILYTSGSNRESVELIQKISKYDIRRWGRIRIA
jgi:hypothetical protein